MNWLTKKAEKSFHFYTSVTLKELTSKRARTLRELVELIKEVPGSVIYYHTHVFLQRQQRISPEPPNAFAYWVSTALGEYKLGEKLASIEICESRTIRELREKLITMIEEHLFETKESPRHAPEGREFEFIKAHSFVLPTPYVAHNLKEFTEILEKITIHSLYFHIFEAKLRIERGTNDFSFWIDTSIGLSELAKVIASLDPYSYTMEGLRNDLIKITKDWCTKNG